MRTNSGQTVLVSAWAASESMATAPVGTAAGSPHDIASLFYGASDRAIREIDAYVLGLHVHVRLSRLGRASSREGH
jgi:hypothetical protein